MAVPCFCWLQKYVFSAAVRSVIAKPYVSLNLCKVACLGLALVLHTCICARQACLYSYASWFLISVITIPRAHDLLCSHALIMQAVPRNWDSRLVLEILNFPATKWITITPKNWILIHVTPTSLNISYMHHCSEHFHSRNPCRNFGIRNFFSASQICNLGALHISY